MQKVGPQASPLNEQETTQSAPTFPKAQPTDIDAFRRSIAPKGIEITNNIETIAGIEIRYEGIQKGDIQPFGVKLFDSNGTLKLTTAGSSFDVDSNTNFISVSIDKSGNLHLDVVDKEKGGKISSRELIVSKDRSVTVGEPRVKQKVDLVEKDIPFSISQTEKDELFYNGVAEAEKALQKQFPGSRLRIEATGTLVRDIKRPEINPIELQEIIFIDKQGSETTLGSVLPEKTHLLTMKSSAEVRDEILKRAEEILKYRVTDSRPISQQNLTLLETIDNRMVSLGGENSDAEYKIPDKAFDQIKKLSAKYDIEFKDAGKSYEFSFKEKNGTNVFKAGYNTVGDQPSEDDFLKELDKIPASSQPALNTESIRFKIEGPQIQGLPELVVNPNTNRELHKKVQELLSLGFEITPIYNSKAGASIAIMDRNKNLVARAEGSNLERPTEKSYLDILDRAVNNALYKPEFGYKVRFEDGLSIADLMRSKVQLLNDRDDPVLSKMEFSQTSAESGPYKVTFNNEPITEAITIRKGVGGGLEFVIGNKGGSAEIISTDKQGRLIGKMNNNKFEPTVRDLR